MDNMNETETIWEKNKGQGDFDFESLMNLTDENFVKTIKRTMELFKILAISVQNRRYYVTVILVTDYTVQTFIYNRNNKKSETTFLTNVDLDWIGSVMKNVK